jgi:CHASE3 domain sensor protein
MTTFQIIMLTIAGTLLFVYVVVLLLIIRDNNRDLKEIEERIKDTRRRVAELEGKDE